MRQKHMLPPLKLTSFGILRDNHKVPWSSEVKYLRITLTKRLRFAFQSAKLVEKAERSFQILYSFLNRKPFSIFKLSDSKPQKFFKRLSKKFIWTNYGSKSTLGVANQD
jgi:hypothetical protein